MSVQTWTQVNPIDNKLRLLQEAKVHVFADSVLYVGCSAMSGRFGKMGQKVSTTPETQERDIFSNTCHHR